MLDAPGDGDGWTRCALGHRHWGLHGAAGLLLHRAEPDGAGSGEGSAGQVLLQHRAVWSHHGDTWGLLGGARHGHETPVAAALREAAEEGGVLAGDVSPIGRYDDAHGGWTYSTVLAEAGPGVRAQATGGESIEVAWFAVEAVSGLALHPGFASGWSTLQRSLRPLSVVVDAANVVGSRPDGWWRDRAGAARRLIDSCARLAHSGLAGDDVLRLQVGHGRLTHWWPRWTLVVEGAARAAAQVATPGVDVVAADGSGDDTVVATVVDTVRDVRGPVVVVTADRALAHRCQAEGATVTGPRWLTRLIEEEELR